MNTPQNTVLANIARLLGDISALKRVGVFPDDIERLGANLPAALISDGDQTDYRGLPGRRLQYAWRVYVWLYHDAQTERQQSLNTLSDSVIDALMSSGLGAVNIEMVSVEKGEAVSAKPDFHSPGVYHHLTVQRIAFDLLLTDTRS